jgi:hypothetical protein
MFENLPPFARRLPDGRLGLWLDASMCAEFNTCHRMFHYKYVLSKRPKVDFSAPRDIGTWWSLLMQKVFDDFLLGKKYGAEEVMLLGAELWINLGYEQLEAKHPNLFKSFGGVHGACAMAAHYAATQLPVDYASWHIVAVESIFGRHSDIVVGETHNWILYWCGKPDLCVVYSGRLSPVDHKTKSTITNDTPNLWKPSIQLPGYIFALQQICAQLGRREIIDRVIVNVAARNAPSVNPRNGGAIKPRFQRMSIIYSPVEIAEWKRERLLQAQVIYNAVTTGVYAMTGAPNTCHSHFNAPCSFRVLCSKPEAVRGVILNSDFVSVKPWTPWREADSEASLIQNQQQKGE